MLDALKLDFLDHQAWENLTIAAAGAGDFDHARVASLMATVTGPDCIDSLVLAVRLQIGSGEFETVGPLLMDFGYRVHGEALFDAMRADIEEAIGHVPPEVDDALERISSQIRRLGGLGFELA
jgi:hypothetical protein